MAWYVNLILGLLIGSWAASYSEGYRNMFRGVFNWLAKKTSTSKKPKEKK